MYTPFALSQQIPQPQLVPVAQIPHTQVNPSLFAYRQSQWQRHFCPHTPGESLLFECKCQVIDARHGVMDADIFVSERYVSLLVDRHCACAIPLRTVACWCRAAVLETPGLPPYVRLSVYPNMEGDTVVRKIPQISPSGLILFTNDDRVHKIFGFAESLDKVIYFIDSNWRKNHVIEAPPQCMPSTSYLPSPRSPTAPAMGNINNNNNSSFFAQQQQQQQKQQLCASGMSPLAAKMSSTYTQIEHSGSQNPYLQPPSPSSQQQYQITPPPPPVQSIAIPPPPQPQPQPQSQPQPSHPQGSISSSPSHKTHSPNNSNIPNNNNNSNSNNNNNNNNNSGNNSGATEAIHTKTLAAAAAAASASSSALANTGGFVVVQAEPPRSGGGEGSGDGGAGGPGDVGSILRGSVCVAWDKMPIAAAPNVLTFSLGADQAQVDYEYKETVVLSNRGSSRHSFSVVVPVSDKYEVRAEPSEGTLKGGRDVAVTFSMKILCTCVVQFDVSVVTWKGDAKERDKAAKSHAVFHLEVESEPSVKLDYSELILYSPPVGSGSFGDVYRGEYRDQEVAIKVLKYQEEITEDMLRDFHSEVKMMEKLRNNYIITFVGAVHIPGKLAIVTEYCPFGSLTSAVKKKSFHEIHRIKALLDVANGLVFLHGSGIMHRDLKPDNILMVSKEVRSPVMCKISDFGTTRGVNKFAKAMNLTRGVGTPIFMAPELISGARNYEKSADVYSFGLTMCNVITGKTPFEGDTSFVTSYRKIIIIINNNCSRKKNEQNVCLYLCFMFAY